jgi:hypothetical protein
VPFWTQALPLLAKHWHNYHPAPRELLERFKAGDISAQHESRSRHLNVMIYLLLLESYVYLINHIQNVTFLFFCHHSYSFQCTSLVMKWQNKAMAIQPNNEPKHM